jgi:Ribosomal protein L9, N-terminal domain
VPVTRGIMRNLWFPNKMAEYVTLSKLHELKKENIVPERDPEFPSRRERKVVNAAQAAALAQEAALAEEVYPEEGSAEKVELPRILSVSLWIMLILEIKRRH